MDESILKATKAELYDAISEMSDGDPKELAAMNVIDAIDDLLAAMAASPPLPVMQVTDNVPRCSLGIPKSTWARLKREEAARVRGGQSTAMTKFTKAVTRYTKAGKTGKWIQCPCGEIARVYHFCWSASSCTGCGKMVDKYSWRVE